MSFLDLDDETIFSMLTLLIFIVIPAFFYLILHKICKLDKD